MEVDFGYFRWRVLGLIGQFTVIPITALLETQCLKLSQLSLTVTHLLPPLPLLLPPIHLPLPFLPTPLSHPLILLIAPGLHILILSLILSVILLLGWLNTLHGHHILNENFLIRVIILVPAGLRHSLTLNRVIANTTFHEWWFVVWLVGLDHMHEFLEKISVLLEVSVWLEVVLCWVL